MRESRPGASIAAGFPRKNWMPAFAGMTFPCLYVALLAPLRDHGQLIGRVGCKALEPDSGADQQMIRGAGNGAKKTLRLAASVAADNVPAASCILVFIMAL